MSPMETHNTLRKLEDNTNKLVAYTTKAMTEALNRDNGALDPEEAAMFTVLVNLLKMNERCIKDIYERLDNIEHVEPIKPLSLV